jgi:hypothetical protein
MPSANERPGDATTTAMIAITIARATNPSVIG